MTFLSSSVIPCRYTFVLLQQLLEHYGLSSKDSSRQFRYKEIVLTVNQLVSAIAILKFVMLTTTTPATRVLHASPVSVHISAIQTNINSSTMFQVTLQGPIVPGSTAMRYPEPTDPMWRQLASTPCIAITDSPRAFEVCSHSHRVDMLKTCLHMIDSLQFNL